MKKTNKKLEEELSSMISERDKWYGKYKELEKEKNLRIENEMFSLKNESKEQANQIRNLLEIIRWQINPETAKFPFLVEKNQREDTRKF